ncbi:hypothetical protein F511_40011 [Dorcoceras hygrometricum]|uniref:Uncharacterized protein n=1 Tax=Dorcoceras hygrometricum TaxID=472368 RepID=A0A2Z7C0X2_9LAMI|nr:hypothetical protein F511_40011 [Dorcoceras hygrometricum]
MEASNSVYEGAVTEFFVNAKVIAGKIVNFIANRKMVFTKDVFTAVFGLPTEGMVGFLDIPKETVVKMQSRFSGSDVPFRAPNKKKEMKMEFLLLHDIVAKALCAKEASFDMVTSEKFDLMVAITAGLKSQGIAVQVSVLLENLVKDDLGETVKLHPQKVLTSKSVKTYMKKNLKGIPAGESSKQTTTSGTEGGESQIAQPVGKETNAETTAKELTTLTNRVSSLDQMFGGMHDDTNLTRNLTTQLRKQLESAVDGMEIKLDVLKSTLSRKLADNQQNLVALETNMVSHYADSQQQFVDELAFTRNLTTQLRKQLESAVDGMEIKLDVLKSTLSRKLADNQQNLVALETNMVSHYADSQQQFVDELALVKSQLAEMFECIRELRDAKKGKVVNE